MGIQLEQAHAAIRAALAKAEDRGVPSAVAVVDQGGNLLAFSADPRAILAARELAINKAYTALALKAETAALGESTLPGGPFFGLQNSVLRGPLVTFAGGVPLRDPATSEMIGAIGVSGGTLDDDTEISAAGAAALTATGGDA